MEEQLISFETAKLSKEKGFNVTHQGVYNKQGQYLSYCILNNSTLPERDGLRNDLLECTAPTQSLLQRWLREVYHIHINPSFNLGVKEFGGWALNCTLMDHSAHALMCKVSKRFEDIYFNEEIEIFTYENALEIGLQEALKLITI